MIIIILLTGQVDFIFDRLKVTFYFNTKKGTITDLLTIKSRKIFYEVAFLQIKMQIGGGWGVIHPKSQKPFFR